MARKALITGIRGQDGAYLAKLLLEKGYEVWGADRRSGDSTYWRMKRLGIEDDVRIQYMDLLEYSNILRVLHLLKPDEIYNLAAQSFVGASFEQPIVTTQVNAVGVANLLEALRMASPSAHFYQASTSEMFGKVRETPQNELTPFHPRSPYAVSKVYAHCLTVNYREAHGIHASSGILFNHDSPLRGEEFVTRKITLAAARISEGKQERLVLGNLDARRDWGFAGDYVRGMWLMLQQDVPEDYVLATGETHSVREFVEIALARAGKSLRWEGEGAATRGFDRDGIVRVEVSPEFYRPAEVDTVTGDATKACQRLGWKPEISFDSLVSMMVEDDLKVVRGQIAG